ncbi:MAG: nitroreductase family protein [Rhodoferax sp.]|uniref:nitroreductase family protein n=1 Tax=Rhodoferax sp. TaxID=50421 RepID=UPI002719D52E|nr:nitroreductase family protein [Rhodoferax sp.]MDO8449722.1 nitroreductase family protein [Rhodoferax sp.]
MDLPTGHELSEFANALIHSRQNVLPRRLDEPGPSPQQLQEILGAAAAAPDHGRLMPWRFVIVPTARRERLAEVFGQALVDRDPNASLAQIDNAREKAHRAPFLMLAIVRLAGGEVRASKAPERDAHHPEATEATEATEAEVSDAERFVSFGCAIQNIVLSAHAAGFGTGLTSGQAMASPRLRALFGLGENEQAVCCINIGTVTRHKPVRLRPAVSDYVSELD